MRITIAISSMGSGGAERVTSVLANHWARAGHAVTIVTMSNGETDFYALDSRVTRTTLDLLRQSDTTVAAVANNLKRIRALRQAVLAAAPDVAISFMSSTSVLVLSALAGTGIPVIVTERTDPAAWADTGRAWSCLRRVSYSRAAAIVVQTERVAMWARQRWDRPVIVIPNPVDPVFSAPTTREREKLIVGAGRLIDEKRFDLLIAAFDVVSAAHAGWSLAVAGEGPFEVILRAQAERAAHRDRIMFLGRLRDVRCLFERAAIFALTSDVEGFPNVLIEAMASGCAPIATDCRSGPSEIISDGVDGLLVRQGSVEQIASALDELMRDSQRRDEIGRHARASAGRFRVDAIAARWDSVLQQVGSLRASDLLQVVQ